MNRNLKTAVLAIILAISGFLAGCGESPAPTPVVKMVPTPTAEQQWLEARDAIRAIGRSAAQTGGFTKADNCNVVSDQLTASPSYKKFPVLGLETYKGACRYEVAKGQKPKTMTAKTGAVKQAKPAVKHGTKVAVTR